MEDPINSPSSNGLTGRGSHWETLGARRVQRVSAGGGWPSGRLLLDSSAKLRSVAVGYRTGYLESIHRKSRHCRISGLVPRWQHCRIFDGRTTLLISKSYERSRRRGASYGIEITSTCHRLV